MIAYLGEVVKMCANICYLMMTLNRYLLVGKDHTAWLVTGAKLEFKWVIRGSILFSLLINIGHGWEYKVIDEMFFLYFKTDSHAYYQTVSISYLSEYSGTAYSNYPYVNNHLAVFYYILAYFALNFLVFFVLNTVLEVLLVVRMRKELREKRERLAKMQHTPVENNADAASQHQQQQQQQKKKNKKEEKEEEDWKKERRVIVMVVLNGVLNFILRTPDILVLADNIHLTGHSGLFVQVSTRSKNTPGVLNLLVDVGYFTYILTFSSNFLIFYFFNLKFKEFVVFFSKSKKTPSK
jgi:hypothetical protein